MTHGNLRRILPNREIKNYRHRAAAGVQLSAMDKETRQFARGDIQYTAHASEAALLTRKLSRINDVAVQAVHYRGNNDKR